MGHLTELTIRSFRHAAPCTLRFSPGMNVIVGRNGTGKSNLLALLQCVATFDFRPLRDEPFDVSWVWVHEDIALRMAFRCDGAAPSQPGSAVVWSLELSVERAGLRLLEAQADGRSVHGWFLGDERVQVSFARTAAHEPWGAGLALAAWMWVMSAGGIVTGPIVTLWQRLTVGLMGVGGARILDEGVDVYRAWVETRPSTIGLRWWRTGAQAGTWIEEGFPQGVLLASGVRPAGDTLRFDRSSLPWLREFCDLAGFADLRLSVSVSGASEREIRFANWDVRAQLDEHMLRRGEALSRGQKRLLAALLVRESAPDVFLADDLSTGLHHEWVEVLVRSLERRQSFLTTQSGIILDMLPVENAAVLAHSLVVCVRGEGGWSWRQLDAALADDLVAAHSVGLQRTSEALLVRGLW